MNSWNSSTNETTNSKPGFNSPALGSGSGLSRPRFVKLRKQTNKPSSTTAPGTYNNNCTNYVSDQGFNPFTRISDYQEFKGNVVNEPFLFGANNIKSNVVDDLRNLSIGDGGGGVDEGLFSDEMRRSNIESSGVSKLPDEMGKLNIESLRNVDVENVDGVLPDEIKKLNIKDGLDFDGSKLRSSGFGRGDQGGYSLFGSSEDVLDDKLKNLNIKDGVVGSSSSSVGGGKVDDNASFGDKSSVLFGARKVEKDFTFQAGLQGKSKAEVLPDFNSNIRVSGTMKPSSLFSSNGFGLQPPFKTFDFPFLNQPAKTASFEPYMEFKTPNPKENLVSVLNRKVEAKRESVKDTRSKKKKENLRNPTIGLVTREFVLGERGLHEIHESSESYSPMDVSPYEETLADNNYSKEISVAADEAGHVDDNYSSSESHPTVASDAIDEDLVAATHQVDINKADEELDRIKDESSACCSDKTMTAEGPAEECTSGTETESFMSAAEQFDYSSSSDTFVTAADSEVSSSSPFERQESDGRAQLTFASNTENTGSSGFTFAASSYNQCRSPADLRQYKKKNRLKEGHDTYSSMLDETAPHESSTAQFFPLYGSSLFLPPRQDKKGDASSGRGSRSEPVKELEVKLVTASTSAASTVAQEACEKWRLRGNQAYANGDLSKAEEYYTNGLACVPQSETSKSCLRALMLCYSNRAATLMSLGRMREALRDCLLAAELDPSFFRVQVRAANCYLALGEIDNASAHFMKCLQSENDGCLDRKLLVEAYEGLERAKKVWECMKQSAELLQKKIPSDAECALREVEGALTISSFSENLQEMKANILFTLRRYEEVIQFCEQTVGSAETNILVLGSKSNSVDGHELQKSFSFSLWRWKMIIKSYFYLGRLDEALEFFKKKEDLVPSIERIGNQTLESMIPLACTIRELLGFKVSGNEAFQYGRHAEAIEHYTAALSRNVESCPFAAICFCNRAAAYQAMGQITSAIADCNLAVALDGNYVKAISRRATLFETIRDFGQAATDLQRLVSVLKKHVEEKGYQCEGSDRISRMNELKQTQQRLSVIEEEARKEIPLNMYLILGVEPSAPTSEIKKAYRKAALKHHPDKAGQSLTRSEIGDDGLWKEIAEEVHKDTDRLFKMIGEAYAILSDPVKRLTYDQEEEMRNGRHTRGSRNSTSRTNADVHNYPFGTSSSRRHWPDGWKTYADSQPTSSSRRHWPDVWKTYANSQPTESERTRSNRYT